MPIISRVEAHSRRGKIFFAGLILVLSLGGVTMVYPFLLMISGSMRSQMDAQDMTLIPAYLVESKPLARKFLETKYNDKVQMLNRSERQHYYDFKTATIPSKIVPQRIKDLRQFIKDTPFPNYWWNLGGVEGFKSVPENLQKMRSILNDKFHGDLVALGKALGAPIQGLYSLIFTSPTWLSQQYNYHSTVQYDVYFEMLNHSPLAERSIDSVSGYFVETMLRPEYGSDKHVDEYNKSHRYKLKSFDDFVLPPTVPGKDQPVLRQEWLKFVTTVLSPSFVELTGIGDQAYQAYCRKRYETITKLNEAWDTNYTSFAQIKLPSKRWLLGGESQIYMAFLKTIDPSHYRIQAPEYAWRRWLKQHYHGDLAALNKAEQTHYASFTHTKIPMADLEYHYVLNHAGSLRWAYATRSYIHVIDEIVLHGRALMNTVIYCLLAILFALLINPLAAYAMSRFRLPGTYKILLVLMATMAFPPMVTLIPTFIMLRKMSLLNTFAALLLPGIANGYLIFLLKGFFDSLPQDLYEAARIDGASEIRMFFQLTLSLSKPILAWVALGAFTGAYMAFLYPLIVCPDPNMWLISVWIYQFQQTASSAAVYASVLLATIPTFIMFLFAQRTIIRGIVVPVEK